MGGYGSGRWGWATKKTTVEECRVLDMACWTQAHILQAGTSVVSSCRWTSSYSGEETSRIGFELDLSSLSHPWVRLFYTLTRTGEKLDYKVPMQVTRPYWGGLRWWYTCPLVVNGRPCRRRVAKLYLPPGGTYFGCRHCYHLTYTSCQESHKFDLLFGTIAADMRADGYDVTRSEVKRLLKR